MESEGMNAKQFSKEVGISQGTLSNILGGRNNPSLDVLQAVLNRFRTIQSDWLILGIGAMYRPNGDGPQTSIFDIRPDDDKNRKSVAAPESAQIAETTKNDNRSKLSEMPSQSVSDTLPSKQVKRIIVFYTDGTYEER